MPEPGAAATRAAVERPAVTIVVPIHGATEHVDACLRRVVRHTDLQQHRLLVVDDASPDRAVRDLARGLVAAHAGSVAAILRPTRAGFPTAANCGLRLATGDACLLNSDAGVTARWLERLRQAAYSRPDVASVSPLSNDATIFSVPGGSKHDGVPAGYTIDSFAALVERVAARRYPEVPTTHGFCMYMRRAAIDAVGLFDAELFGEGYGEENDWCMRAAGRGFVHLVDDATYVHHAGGASYEPARRARLVASSQGHMLERHPEYPARVAAFFTERRLAEVHERLARALEAA